MLYYIFVQFYTILYDTLYTIYYILYFTVLDSIIFYQESGIELLESP